MRIKDINHIFIKAISLQIVTILLIISVAGCNSPAIRSEKGSGDYEKELELAKTTPYGAYPETVTYTLGKMTSANNSNMPEGDTYENNAYTRYIKEIINVQNEDAFEAKDGQYATNVSMAIAMGKIPDIMVVNDDDALSLLIENDMIEDLSSSYNDCLSDKIKDMYESYGEDLMEQVTFDGKIMAFPETNITDGPNLIWLRKDWMDRLGLEAPQTVEDAMNIVRAFIEQDPGKNGEGNTVGLVCDKSLSGECGYSSEYLLDTIFASFNAYPKQWIKDDNNEIVYGSITQEAKNALEYIHKLYEQNIIDNKFLIRTSANNIELIEKGLCGSFFGPWWAPNNPLVNAVYDDPQADWEPYLLATQENGQTFYHSQNPCYKYVVVRKGYEHPEIAAKIISVLFDKMRYECKNSVELRKYYLLNVEPTARPLAINVDYNNALNLCYQELSDALVGEKLPGSLNLMESSYYDACMEYLYNSGKSYSIGNDNAVESASGRKGATPDQWAAYMSRIKACSLLSSGNIAVVKSLFFGNTYTMKTEWWKLKEKENQAYLKIVCGEENLEYFDIFVKEWYINGGEQITKEVNEIKSSEIP